MSRNENGALAVKNNHQRLCHIVKRDDFDGYGFNLHSEKGKPGQYIGKVDENSPAEHAGLRQGDRIIEVNGVNIGSETHKQVVQRIKAISSEVRLLVIDPNEEKNNITNNNNTTTANELEIETSPSSTIVIQSTTIQHGELSNQKNPDNDKLSVTASPTTSTKSHSSANSTHSNLNNKTPTKDNEIHDESVSNHSHQNGISNNMNNPNTSIDLYDDNNPNDGNNQQQKQTPGLNLPMTAAEMRAKLLARKKYDPKNDSVDLRKKFEIIQKL